MLQKLSNSGRLNVQDEGTGRFTEGQLLTVFSCGCGMKEILGAAGIRALNPLMRIPPS